MKAKSNFLNAAGPRCWHWPRSTSDMDRHTLMLFGGIGAILLLASVIGFILKLRTKGAPNSVIDNLNARINAWWVMVLVIGTAFWLGNAAVILLFYAVSFYALRSEEHTSELQSLMRISYAVFCLKKKNKISCIKTIIQH